jgi:hypothetical protein
MTCEQPNSETGSNACPPTGDDGAKAVAFEPKVELIITFA